jgi:EpsI family protein
MTPDASTSASYRSASGQAVSMTLLYYRNQNNGKALISSVNRLTSDELDEAWHANGASTRVETLGTRQLAVRETRLQGPQGRMLVWHWFRIGQHDTVSNVVGKLRQAESKLLFRGDDGAAVMLAAPYGEQPDEARAALHAFLAAHMDAIDTALTATGQR